MKNLSVQYLLKVGYKDVDIIPISALEGLNIHENSKYFSWYNGPCLFECLATQKCPKRLVQKDFRMPIVGTNLIRSIGYVNYGKIKSGVVKVGDQVAISG